MARSAPYQTGFTAGEISPRLFGRIDMEKFAFGLAQCQNYLCLREGPIERRPGTRFVGEVLDSTVRSRLMPFVFSDEQAYILEFGHRKLRIFTLESRLLVATKQFSSGFGGAGDIDTAADTITIPSHTYAENQGPFTIQFSAAGNPSGIPENTPLWIERVDNDTFKLRDTPGGPALDITSVGINSVGTITPFSGLPLEIDTPYESGALSGVEVYEAQSAQTADILYLVHPAHPPQKLSRVDAASWRLEEAEFYDGPYEAQNGDTSYTMTPNSTSGAVNVTASQDTFVVGRDEGKLLRYENGVEQDPPQVDDFRWGFLRIDTVNSATSVSGEWVRGPDSITTPASPNWRLGLYYTGNYPAAVTFHEQRLVLGAPPSAPQRFDGSVIGDFENFAPTGGPIRSAFQTEGRFYSTISDDNAYAFTIASDRVNGIAWMNSIRNLIAGTVGGIWPVQASSALESVGPNSINVRRSSVRGSRRNVRPVNVDDAVVYVSATGRRLYAINYAFESDSFKPRDITALADHIGQTGIVQIDYAADPDSIVWGCREDGRLIGVTLDFEEQIEGWHQHVLGGSLLGGDPVVESVAVIPAPTGAVSAGAHPNEDHDQVWMVVRRTIAGQERRYVEFMEDRFPDDAEQADGYFVDCGLSYEGSATDTVVGLSHLEGETVSVNAEGAAHPERVVASGEITLDYEATRIHVGLRYDSEVTFLPLENAGTRTGPSQGMRKRADHIVPRFYRTLGMEIARDAARSEWEAIKFRRVADPIDAAPPLFPKPGEDPDLPILSPRGWGLSGQHTLRQRLPLPSTILSVGYRSQSSERGNP